ncbi:ABC transporter permease [Nonomuraea soli]|uniref:ABC-2 type transport system permease protein n=1 Tax=Nonomuraea soli TaxID=1032476 RepID=A0A7W0CGQ5_9ACTN|nr:ABC transporter permease [Nonomuraea soli]MBA2890714.1 ABC-2 type transport system permease protein [Nonomuraea soli]
MTGTMALVRLALRRDRSLLPGWILVIVGVVAGTASAIAELYPGMDDRLALGLTIGSTPALQAITGPVYDPASVGGLTAWRATTIAAVLAALMSLLLVTRHTRAEEESGRAELVGACAVGRHAFPAAALVVAGGANLLIAALITAALTAQGLPVSGALAFGLAIAGTGWIFAGVAAVTAQLTEHARTANGLAAAVLGAAFLLRAAGDAGGWEALSWASPLGWAQRVRAFADERWWVIGLALLTAVTLVLVAAALIRRRDLGSGVLPPRTGPADAPPYLSSALGLAWRLHRGGVLGWAAGFAVMGALFGALAHSAGQILGGNPQLAAILERLGGESTLVDTFLVTVLGMMGLVAGAFAVQAVLRLQGEEAALRAEHVLSAAVTRPRWALAHLLMAWAGSAAVLGMGGLAIGAAHGIRTGEPGQVIRLAAAAWVQLPAVWVAAGLTMLLYGLLPRLTALAWAMLLSFALLGQLGEVLQLPEWMQRLSPYSHLPQAPGGELDPAPLIWLAVLALVLAGVGVAAFRRRDLTGA